MIFYSFLILGIASIVTFFVAREALLYLGSKQIKDELLALTLADSRGDYVLECQKKGSNIANSQKIAKIQMKFISSTEYIKEVICSGFTFSPVTIGDGVLMNFISKVPGTSGYTIDQASNGIEITVFAEEIKRAEDFLGRKLDFLKKKEAIFFQNGKVIYEDGIMGNGPVTSCTGYGYFCCLDNAETGTGAQITGLNDCANSCYQSCVKRPLVLSLNTNPVTDFTTRKLEIISGDVVEFNYVAGAEKTSSISATFNFGDGKTFTMNGNTGQTTHVYTCDAPLCNYKMNLSLQDQNGQTSAMTPASQINVVVSN